MKLGILFLHGYTGGRYELLPLINYLGDRYDFVIEAPEYPGHGKKLLIKNTNEEMWFEAAEKSYIALREKCDTVIVIGFSMGGVIAGLLSLAHQPDKLILIAPAFDNINLQYMVKYPYTYIHNMRYADLRILEFMLFRTFKVDYKSLVSFKKLQQRALYVPEQITANTLIIHGTIDGLVPIQKSRQLVKRIKKAKLIEIEKGPHEICLSKMNKKVFYEVEKFIFKNKSIN
ncbi:alpha/beta hydrolase [Mammaliicoccus stepanovicii]|uniref:Carboxylesterase n=1 Tax=Mammaliicoccus stepanovicii TaxID=643214 RepID=A0A239YQ82_9STAP|nr:alpha/beta fold hydrolase [Mammaliicoccus stepanovicii]PNZ78948.1 hypothetical protein CD111_01970 [Mammaliicoccus stepanovicii]GGI41297.1 carboxylesterase [Mammaliicoccus stepanovicii]SNV60663.1 carboxylesterase [Mammaliicoccus stepanovicii]